MSQDIEFPYDQWYPSRYGEDDELGALNQLSSVHAQRAATLVKTGKSYAMGVPVDSNSPAYGVRKYECHVHMPLNFGDNLIAANQASCVDEFIMFWPGVGSHIDGLGHVGIGNRFYNGHTVDDVVDVSGLKKFSLHALPPIVSRGVLLDIAKLYEVEMLESGQVISVNDIERCLKGMNLVIEAGDVILIRTGWIKLRDKNPGQYLESAPGISKAAAQYLAESGAIVVGCDQGCTEVYPSENANEFAPVHQINLAIYGVYQLQHICLEAMAEDNLEVFMFVLGVPRLAGASQMTVNPVAIA